MAFKGFKLLLISCCALTQGYSQSKAGLTGTKDTSYTTHSAFVGSRKKHPEIEVVAPFRLKTVKEKRNITYCQSVGRPLQLDVFYPSAKSKLKRPAVLFVHGGGWRSGNRTQHHPLAQRLAGLGYVCFTPEYRLSTEALYPAAVEDLRGALKWVYAQAEKFGIDTAKIAIAGFSAGGQLASLLGATQNNPQFATGSCLLPFSGRVDAVINLDGILSFVHPESGEGDDSKKTSSATYWFGFSKGEAPKLWEEASALTHAGAGTPPTLFINSGVDRMHAGREDFIKILKSHGVYTEVKTFGDAPHSFPLFHPWFEPTVQAMDAFLKKVFGKTAL